MRRTLVVLGLLIWLLLAAFNTACGEGDSDDGDAELSVDEIAVEQTIRSAVDAYERQDLPAFLSFWTDEGLQDGFDATRQEIMSAGPDFFGGPPRLVRSFEATDVNGNKASTEVEWAVGMSLMREGYELVRPAGAWKISSVSAFNVSIPKGVDTIDVDMDEFSYEFDAEEIKSGNIAFKADNVGEQLHELVLLKVPAELTPQQLLRLLDHDLPGGIEIIGFTIAEPGDDRNLVFTSALKPGKYMMVCFLPDEDDRNGTPHAVRGMISEFNITSQGGN